MSDYTPTTEEVRDVYQSRLIKKEANIYVLIDEDQANAEFDRWFEQTKKLAVADFFTENGLSYRARALKAKAWEEGHSVGLGDALFEPEDYTKNPYRQGETK